jgi:hypothetical protein
VVTPVEHEDAETKGLSVAVVGNDNQTSPVEAMVIGVGENRHLELTELPKYLADIACPQVVLTPEEAEYIEDRLAISRFEACA